MELVDVKILFFAASKELAGKNETTLSIKKKISFTELKQLICSSFGLEAIANCIVIALNQSYIEEEREIILQNNDELAVIPPLSAG
jgi:molybdopterin converting factor subunit 1